VAPVAKKAPTKKVAKEESDSDVAPPKKGKIVKADSDSDVEMVPGKGKGKAKAKEDPPKRKR
jgi:DNA topoisomerase-2